MPKYDQDLIRRVSEENDIVEIISEYVPLKQKGKTYTACCPFHNEKTPSFHVDREKQLYHCFGCGAGGNLYKFVMEKENINFVEAVQYLAQRAGIELPKNSKENDKQVEKRSRLYSINRLTGNFYYKKLKQNQEAKKYLLERELDDEIIREFGLGYAPEKWSTLTDLLHHNGFYINDIVDSGVALRGKNNRVYDRFRNRIIFPIQDAMGKVIGFGARKFRENDNGPKYLNSPETEIFNKGTQLYNFNRARSELKGNKPLILVEGYMDVIALAKYGIKNTAAALGTAFTANHAKLISRFTKNVILCFDGDQAGEKATLRALEILSNSDLNIKVVRLPVEHDPDTFIKENGKEAFQKYLDNALTDIDFKLKNIEKKYNLRSPEGIFNYMNDCCKVLASLDQAKREVYGKLIAKKTNLTLTTILEKIDSFNLNQSQKETSNLIQSPVKKTRRVLPLDLLEAQTNILIYCYKNPNLIDELGLNELLFSGPFYKWLFRKLNTLRKPNLNINELIVDEKDHYYLNTVTNFFFNNKDKSFEKSILDKSIDIIHQHNRKDKIDELTHNIAVDQDEKGKIFDQVVNLKKVDWNDK